MPEASAANMFWPSESLVRKDVGLDPALGLPTTTEYRPLAK
jgi:hypothetical protein